MRKSADDPQERTCNCRIKDSCPLEGKCLSDNLIYQATVTSIPPPQNQTPTNQTDPPQTHTYIGLASTTFKIRIGNHKKSFNHRKYGKETTLSRLVWELKDQGCEYNISWKMIERAQPFSPITGVCALCTTEKWYILFKPELATINKRDEINNHCFHKVPVLLDNT